MLSRTSVRPDAPTRRPTRSLRRSLAVLACSGALFAAGLSAAQAAPTTTVSPLSVGGSISKAPAPGNGRSVDSFAPPPVDTRTQVLQVARSLKGIPYVYGGTTPAGFDCSGFTSYVYRQVGVNLPRTSSSQAGVGYRVPASQALPGDLMWRPGHVGIYTGGGMMIHSPHTGSVVSEVRVYASDFVYIRVL